MQGSSAVLHESEGTAAGISEGQGSQQSIQCQAADLALSQKDACHTWRRSHHHFTQRGEGGGGRGEDGGCDQGIQLWAAAVEAVRGSPSIPVECLSQIRKRNKRFRMTCSARSCKPVLYQTLNRGPGELILHCMEKGPDAREGDAPGYNGISLAANTDAVESCGPMGSIILDSPPFGELQYMENSTIAHSTPQ
ncbi:uncharacterized protein LOC120405975 isoform X2 [Mauremys reevesii]|uniref:uncharacterized protein LOC120405975 isoform X2 n=1 Tax=Mauremys reevesii TaxID=260615 RepID=UPI00193FED25|nr:uncharacterized protein LOC120405975 isoform X2 [Mauremys reevesii]